MKTEQIIGAGKTQLQQASPTSPKGPNSGAAPHESFSKIIETAFSEWNSIEAQSGKQIAQMGGRLQSLFSLQVSINKIGMQVNLLSKAAETLSGSLRQLQQSNGG